MANFTVAAGNVAKHAWTLTANQVDTITFADNIGTVDVITDGTADVYFTVDGSTPTVAGANCYRIPGAGGAMVDTRTTLQTSASGGADVVKVISAGTPSVSVQKGDR
jgi:hypothetical protein